MHAHMSANRVIGLYKGGHVCFPHHVMPGCVIVNTTVYISHLDLASYVRYVDTYSYRKNSFKYVAACIKPANNDWTI